MSIFSDVFFFLLNDTVVWQVCHFFYLRFVRHSFIHSILMKTITTVLWLSLLIELFHISVFFSLFKKKKFFIIIIVWWNWFWSIHSLIAIMMMMIFDPTFFPINNNCLECFFISIINKKKGKWPLTWDLLFFYFFVFDDDLVMCVFVCVWNKIIIHSHSFYYIESNLCDK